MPSSSSQQAARRVIAKLLEALGRKNFLVRKNNSWTQYLTKTTILNFKIVKEMKYRNLLSYQDATMPHHAESDTRTKSTHCLLNCEQSQCCQAPGVEWQNRVRARS